METGVARRGIADFDAYADKLARFVFRSGFMMKPLFAKAREAKKRVHLFRGRGRAGAARDPGRAGGAHRRARADRPAGGHRGAHPALRPGAEGRERISRSIDPRSDPRYRDYVADYLKVAGPQGRDARRRQDGGAHVALRDRRAGAASRRRRRAALRAGGALRIAAEAHQGHRRPRARAQGFRRAVAGDRRDRRLLSRRHPCALRSQRRGDRRHGDGLRPPRAPIRRDAEDRADLAFRFRLRQHPVRAEDARGAGASARARAGSRGRRRDAGRHRALDDRARSA